MIRKLFWIFVVVALVAGGYLATHEYQRRRLIETLNATLSTPDTLPRKALALDLVESNLARLDNPTLYAFVNAASVQALAARLGELATTLPSVGGLEALTIRPTAIGVEDAAVTVTIAFEGTLKQLPVTLKGTAAVVAAPAFDGADLTLYPVDARLRVDDITLGGRSDRTVLPTLISAVGSRLVDYLASRVGSISIPLELGMAGELDLAKVLADVKELQRIEQGVTRVHVALASPAVLATQEGLHLVATARFVSQAELDGATNELRAMRKQVGALPTLPTCESCQFTWPKLDTYAVCLRKRLDCQADIGLGVRADRTHLSPVQALALRTLAQSRDPGDQQIARVLRPFLLPSLRAAAPPPDAGAIDRKMSELTDRVIALRNAIEPADAFADGASIVAVKKDLLATSLNQIAGLLSPKASLALDTRQIPINQTISSPPSANLNCGKNERGCPSDFDADYAKDHVFSPGGCASSCMERKCESGDIGKFLNGGREICYDAINLECAAKKLVCEATKERDRLEFEGKKALAKGDWLLKKADCERLKATERIGCELNQQWLNLTGDKELGRIDGNATVSAARSEIVFGALQVTPALDQVDLNLSVRGEADVNASFVFTPLGAGHVACISQWGGGFKAAVSLPPSDIRLHATFDPQASSARELVYRVAAVDTAIKMSPPPGVALLNQNPHMALACPAIGALVGASPLTVTIGLTLLDTIPVQLPAREIRIPVFNPQSLTLLGTDVTVTLGKQSLLLRAK